MMQKNRRLIALPNVLRDQTEPNTLGGMRAAPASVRRIQLPVRAIALAAGVVIAILVILLGRAA